MRVRLMRLLLALTLVVAPAAGQARKDAFAGRKGPLKKRQQARRAQMIERLNDMTPEQRERALGRLPEERRKRVERNLERYNELTPEQKRRIQRSAGILESMPPERQQAVRRVYRQMNDLPQERRIEVRREVNRLSRMTAEERETRMNSGDFKSKYSSGEQGMVRELSDLFPPRKEEKK